MLGFSLLGRQNDLLVKIVEDRVKDHVLAFPAENHAKLCVNTCVWLAGAEKIVNICTDAQNLCFS